MNTLRKIRYLLMSVSVIVALGRFSIADHALSLSEAYEAFVHIWVGALMACVVLRAAYRGAAGVGLFMLMIVEVLAFLGAQ